MLLFCKVQQMPEASDLDEAKKCRHSKRGGQKSAPTIDLIGKIGTGLANVFSDVGVDRTRHRH